MSRNGSFQQPPTGAGHLWFAWLLYVGFVVYGSLVPLDFHPRPLAEAWIDFQRVRYFTIGVAGRADWIANGVLYVPLAFLSALVLGVGRRGRGFSAAAGGFLFCAAIAVVVEFLQLFFPPRTVSLNDLLAEFVGSAVGTGLAFGIGQRVRDLVAALSGVVATLGQPLLMAYAAAYCAFSFFPYDVLVSGLELRQKLGSGQWGWIHADGSMQRGALVAFLKCAVEALASAPLGALLAPLLPQRSPFFQRAAFASGAAIGTIIEVGQLFLASGVSQGISVLSRALGMTIGAMLWQTRADLPQLVHGLRRFAPHLAALYLLTMAGAHGWFGSAWSMAEVAGKLDKLRFLPFYYHYYTSEATAVISLLSACLMYAPVAYLTWSAGTGSAAAVLAAVAAAIVFETGKLFTAGTHPDPSNIWIAALTAWGCARLIERVSRKRVTHAGVAAEAALPGGSHADRASASQPALGDGSGSARRVSRSARETGARVRQVQPMDVSLPETAGNAAGRKPSLANLFVLIAVAAAVVFGVADYPFHREWLAVFLVGYGALLWRYPALVVAAIPAALPLLDFAPWSGRFYLDEFDFVLAISIAVGYARIPAATTALRSDWLLKAAVALVAISYAISAMRGLLPWQAIDANSFSSYYSPYNALRIAKGAFWGVLCLGLLRRAAARGDDVAGLFARGMVVGLSGTVAVIGWERLTFSGLLNFTGDYRVTGPFSQLHTGGADMETVLTVAVPFLVFVLVRTRHWLVRGACLLLMLGATYALMVTFSRGAYVAYGSALGLALLAVVRESAVTRGSSLRRMVFALAAGMAVLAVAVPVIQGKFAQSRLSVAERDLGVRQNHWEDALRMRDQNLVTGIVGMGLGRYPEMHYWRSTENKRSAVYRVLDESGNSFLRLAPGNPIYVEQPVAVSPQREYTLSLDLRSPQPGRSLAVGLCEKWLFASYNCVELTIQAGVEAGRWTHHERRVVSAQQGRGRWFAARPVKLALHPGASGAVDVDNIKLEGQDGEQLIANGTFDKGFDRWFFSVDDHMPWHIFNLPVGLLFDQGWLGVVSFGLLAILALGRAARGVWSERSLTAGVVLAALGGFFILGLVNSLVDSPRITLLFLLLACLATLPERRAEGSRF